MADLHVETKKNHSSSAWIWILLLVLIAAIVGYFLLTRDNDADDVVTPASPTSYLDVQAWDNAVLYS